MKRKTYAHGEKGKLLALFGSTDYLELAVNSGQAISDGDAESVRREAHSIKGGAANLTATALSGIAFDLENIGKSGMLEEGIDSLQKLEREFFRLERFVAKRDDIN